MSLSLYLHIPFCRHRCAYCDFNTYTSLDDLKADYADALSREILFAAEVENRQAGQGKQPVHTIFFGGGTPSLMSPQALEQILSAVRQGFDLSPAAEITLEANPDTVEGSYLSALRGLGVNRLSYGVQSAIPTELALLEREHDFETVIRSVERARTAGFNNLNLDLIYGLPDQTLQSWEKSVRAALALKPEHLSLYCLTIEPGTPMHRWLNNGRITAPDPDLAADQYQLACELMAEHGFVHYEISNWAIPDHACDHNLTYWRNQEYLGLGAGAHGHAAGYRYSVVKQPRVYIRRMDGSGTADPSIPYPATPAVAQIHQLNRQERMSDTIITQLRLLQEGLDLSAFQQTFGQTLFDAYPGTAEQLIEFGLLHQQNNHLLLTQKGWFLSNQVFYRFM
ncbi:MAG: radical SAM family heme chaperone HemW [Candidatus Promineifilaceae bacterium]